MITTGTGKSRQGMSMLETSDKMRYAVRITEGYKGIIKIEKFKCVPTIHIQKMQLKDIKTCEELGQWIREQEENKQQAFHNDVLLFDDYMTVLAVNKERKKNEIS